MKTTVFICLFLISFFQVNAQVEDFMVKKGFLIVSASKDYEALKKQAQIVSKQLNYKLDFRGLEFNDEIGLSFSEEECEQAEFEYPVYISRGRFDDGNYVSIEYTNGYTGFTPGLYIIIVSSYEKGDKELDESLNYVKKHFKTAYIKYADVYMGCMH